jgi:hypothetical protein
MASFKSSGTFIKMEMGFFVFRPLRLSFWIGDLRYALCALLLFSGGHSILGSHGSNEKRGPVECCSLTPVAVPGLGDVTPI